MIVRTLALVCLLCSPVQAALVPTIAWIDTNTALIGVPVGSSLETSVYIVDAAQGSVTACEALRNLENVVRGSTVHRGVVFGLRGQFSYEGNPCNLIPITPLESEEPIYVDAKNALLYSFGFDSNEGVLRDLIHGIRGLLGVAQDPECTSSLRIYDLNGGQRPIARVQSPVTCLTPRSPFDSMAVRFGDDIYFLGESSLDERARIPRLVHIDKNYQIALATKLGEDRLLRTGTVMEDRALMLFVSQVNGELTYGVLKSTTEDQGVPVYQELGIVPDEPRSKYDVGGTGVVVYREASHTLRIIDTLAGTTDIVLPGDFKVLALAANPASGCMLLGDKRLLVVSLKGSDWGLRELTF